MVKDLLLLATSASLLVLGVVGGCKSESDAVVGTPVAFSRFPGWDSKFPSSEDQLKPATTDYFHDMDGGVALNPDEVQGRNTWLMWSSDNNKFWDWLATHSYGVTDLLKVLDSRKRESRFRDMGLINEPGFQTASKADEFGLWLDEPIQPSTPDQHVLQMYGDSSGVVGLRLFPNPKFDAVARNAWDANRYYNDPTYYTDKNLVRPYRVGMACSFCHVAPNPVSPPSDPEHPEWKNLSSYIGNQYFKFGRIFGPSLTPDNFIYQVLNSQPRGTLDTSLVATDHINNPRTMNSIYNVGARLSVGQTERLTGGALNIVGTSATMVVPHILKDGSDSVGILGALSRVFVNIGEDSDDWIQDLNGDPLIGAKPYHPFDVAKAQKDSVYWRATSGQVGNLAKFFLTAAKPHPLKDAPGGASYLTTDAAVLALGKRAFAENCASCHSSKLPPGVKDLDSPVAIDWFRKAVAKPDFLDNNFLSNDWRYPISLIGTNACSPSATNSTAGHIWDNFSSQTYKDLPSVGQIECINPVTLEPFEFTMPSGGPGYVRVPTLVSLWASAPFFQNNSLGEFNRAPDGSDLPDPSVKVRMMQFNDAVTKLLWPSKRLGIESIWRTTEVSYLQVPKSNLPSELQFLIPPSQAYVRIGPIPQGTPINLLANLDINFSDPSKSSKMKSLAKHIVERLLLYKGDNWIHGGKLSADQLASILKPLVPELLSLNKCPDFVEDKGHTFGAQLPDEDKKALIEYLKWM
jgi:hypothetical protein